MLRLLREVASDTEALEVKTEAFGGQGAMGHCPSLHRETHDVLLSNGCRNKLHRLGGLKTTHVYNLTVLEISNPKWITLG